MQRLTTLSPRRLQTMLFRFEQVKARHFFFWRAEGQGHPRSRMPDPIASIHAHSSSEGSNAHLRARLSRAVAFHANFREITFHERHVWTRSPVYEQAFRITAARETGPAISSGRRVSRQAASASLCTRSVIVGELVLEAGVGTGKTRDLGSTFRLPGVHAFLPRAAR